MTEKEIYAQAGKTLGVPPELLDAIEEKHKLKQAYLQAGKDMMLGWGQVLTERFNQAEAQSD